MLSKPSSRTILRLATTFVLVTMLLSSLTFAVSSQFEQWVPWIPFPSLVNLDYRKVNGTSYMDVKMELTSTGYNVSNWGNPSFAGSNISVNAEMWRWTGIVIPVLITISHTYNLGNLTKGEYFFIFNVWAFPVKKTSFLAVITVPDDFLSIQEAVNHANEGDTIFVRNGTYYENIVINKTLTLEGESREATIISSTGSGDAVTIISSGTNLNNFTLQAIGLMNHALNLENVSDTTIVNNSLTNSFSSLLLTFSNFNTIRDNNIAPGNYYSIFHNSSHNTLARNSIGGLKFSGSFNNTLAGNTIEALWFDSSPNNCIIHNNFVNAIVDSYTSTNTWDNGCEGNYWSDYNGTDSNNDGIGDTPYITDENNTDNYPLMNLYWNACDVNHDLAIDMKDVAKAARAFGTEPGYSLWNPHADITGTEYLVPDNTVDMKDVSLIAKNFGKEYQ